MKRILAVAAVAAAITGVTVTPAAGGVCLTTNVTVNGTEAPTNGTNCVTLP